LDERLNLAPNLLRVSSRIMSSLGREGFRSRYPELAAMLPRLAAGDLKATTLDQLFLMIRLSVADRRDSIDRFMMQGIRLDVQAADPLGDLTYLDDQTEAGFAARAAIAQSTHLPFADANSLCHISNRHKYLYIETPKVACTAIKHRLQTAEIDGTLLFRTYGEEHFPELSPLMTPLDSPDLFLRVLGGDDWFRFTFVRNPFTRVLSCYLDKIVASEPERQRLLPELGLDPAVIPSFNLFLRAIAGQSEDKRDAHWAPQAWLTQPDTVRYHFIGRLERFRADFDYVCRKVGIPTDIATVRHSTDAGDKLAAFYGPKEIRLVQSIYAEDFLRFGYDRNLPTGVDR
jgi:hypothetical protein